MTWKHVVLIALAVWLIGMIGWLVVYIVTMNSVVLMVPKIIIP